MSRSSDSEKLSGSAMAIIGGLIVAFLALIGLLFSLNIGSGIF